MNYPMGGFYITERIDIQPHTDTLYNKCKSTFQFSNLTKHGHRLPENVFQRKPKQVGANFKCFSVRF